MPSELFESRRWLNDIRYHIDLAQRFAADLDLVLLGQVLACQRRTEALVDVLRENPHDRVAVLLAAPAVGTASAQAVDQGFAHAWTAIFDTHVTTIVSAAILFMFGTGPVKGFATTLVVGLIANLFTAVFVSRVIFDSHVNHKLAGQKLSI